MNLDLLSSVVYEVAFNENKSLENLVGEGIFYMPELAFSCLCGMEIMKNKKAIFGDDDVVWQREINVGNGGPSDSVFSLKDGSKLVIEYKIATDYYAYMSDILKLGRLDDPKFTKIFCALVDTFDKNLPDDGRQIKLTEANEHSVEQLFQRSFPTKLNKYVNPLSCVVGLWAVN
jgi:hypothetical protein